MTDAVEDARDKEELKEFIFIRHQMGKCADNIAEFGFCYHCELEHYRINEKKLNKERSTLKK